jgi:hypothetical protein
VSCDDGIRGAHPGPQTKPRCGNTTPRRRLPALVDVSKNAFVLLATAAAAAAAAAATAVVAAADADGSGTAAAAETAAVAAAAPCGWCGR